MVMWGFDSVPSSRCFSFRPLLFPPSHAHALATRRSKAATACPGPTWQLAWRLEVKAYPPAIYSSPGPHVGLTSPPRVCPHTNLPSCLVAALRCLRLLGYIAAIRGRGTAKPAAVAAHRSIAARDRLATRAASLRRSSRRRRRLVCPTLPPCCLVSLPVRFFLFGFPEFRGAWMWLEFCDFLIFAYYYIIIIVLEFCGWCVICRSEARGCTCKDLQINPPLFYRGGESIGHRGFYCLLAQQ